MQILFPMGGRGTRVRPHTHVRPKPLMRIAGKTVLQHIMDYLMPLNPTEWLFITNPGGHGEQVRAGVDEVYGADVRTRFLVQEQPRGQAHAVKLAEPFVHEQLLVMFIDTLFEADLDQLANVPGDGAVVTHYVADPERFGVAVSEQGRISRFVEKPREPVSHEGLIGVYVFNQPAKLFTAIDTLMAQGSAGMKGNEYYLADATQVMIDQGADLRIIEATVWQDTGTIDAIVGSAGPPFQALNYLLERTAVVEQRPDDCVLIPPVHLPASAKVRNSIIGPYVSIDEGATIANSVLSQTIIGRNAVVLNTHLLNSLIGDDATVEERPRTLNISDHSSVRLA